MMTRRMKVITFAILASLLILGPSVVSGQSLDLIEWHSCVKKDTIFAWRVSHVDFVNDSMEGFLRGLVIQIKIIASPPNDPEMIFNSTQTPNWVSLYINGFKIDFGSEMGGLSTAFAQLVLPIYYRFDNGTSFTLEEIHRLHTSFEEGNVTYSVSNGKITTTLTNGTTSFTTVTVIESGITSSISISMGEFGYFDLDYYTRAANVDVNGESTDIGDEYTEFQDDLMGTIRYLIFQTAAVVVGIILMIVIYIKERRSSH